MFKNCKTEMILYLSFWLILLMQQFFHIFFWTHRKLYISIENLNWKKSSRCLFNIDMFEITAWTYLSDIE